MITDVVEVLTEISIWMDDSGNPYYFRNQSYIQKDTHYEKGNC